jgi:Methylamine utilisation protein MauE
MAWLIPWLELAIALALCWEPSRRAALVSAIAVLIAYATALGVNLLRGRRDLDCGCGAVRSRRVIADWMVWRNLLLASGLGIATLPWSLRPFGVTDLLTVVGGLVAGATLYGAVDRLLGDVSPKAMTLRSTS